MTCLASVCLSALWMLACRECNWISFVPQTSRYYMTDIGTTYGVLVQSMTQADDYTTAMIKTWGTGGEVL